MKWVIWVALASSAVLVTAAQTSSKKPAPASKSKVAARNGKASSATRKRRVRRAAGPSYQMHPDPERYQQIQQALADRGYFKGQVNGQWGDDSVDALKRFQADQKLGTDGKINSLTLNGLGLGPKHDGGVPTPAPVANSTPASSAGSTGAAPSVTPAVPSSSGAAAPSGTPETSTPPR